MHRYVQICTNNVNTPLTERHEPITPVRFEPKGLFEPTTKERLSRTMQGETDRQLTADAVEKLGLAVAMTP